MAVNSLNRKKLDAKRKENGKKFKEQLKKFQEKPQDTFINEQENKENVFLIKKQMLFLQSIKI